jgi:hypothetical protein
MPFKSKSQFRKFLAMAERGEISKKELHKWMKETKNIDELPERVGKSKPKSGKKKK